MRYGRSIFLEYCEKKKLSQKMAMFSNGFCNNFDNLAIFSFLRDFVLKLRSELRT